MKLRVYMNDWSMNMGIVGFLNIFKRVELDYEIIKKENYIEFDSSILENFHDYYFDYFMEAYDLAKRVEKNIQFNINYAKNNEDKIKETSKIIKDSIKYQADKVKKFDVESFNELKIRFDEIGKIKKIEQFDEMQKLSLECVDILKINHINEKLTSNLYKYIVGDNYFGQVSFFNVAKSSLDIQGLKQVMYNDYLLPIIYYAQLQDAINSNELEDVKKFVNHSLEYMDQEIKAKRLSKNSIKIIEKIIKEINKNFIKKEKSIEDIKDYMSNLESCQMCCDIKGLLDNYTESNFAPLAVSADNAMNMYWNMDTNVSICNVCKLMLFCTPAGSTLIRKKYITNEDNEFYSFVNMDTSILDLYKSNINLRSKRDKENPFDELIIDIVSENKEKSKWQLENILFVEFKASVESKKCIMNYFNMSSYLAEFFCDKTKELECVKDRSLKASVIDLILKERDLKSLINEKIREKLTDSLNSSKGFCTSANDIYKVIKIRYTLDCYKKGGKEKVDEKKLKSVRYAGREIHDYYVQNNSKNKIDGIAYRLLNTAKVRNKKDFMDIILRLFMSCEKSIPTVFLDVMAEKELDFESIAYAFISGLISEKYETNTMEGK